MLKMLIFLYISNIICNFAVNKESIKYEQDKK